MSTYLLYLNEYNVEFSVKERDEDQLFLGKIEVDEAEDLESIIALMQSAVDGTLVQLDANRIKINARGLN